MNKLTRNQIIARLAGLERYLNQDWSPFQSFTERMIHRIEYDKLLAQLKEAHD